MFGVSLSRPTVPSFLVNNAHKCNQVLSNVSLVALTGLAFYAKPRDFAKAVAIGALYQITLILFQVDRNKPREVRTGRNTINLGSGGCADIASGFIGQRALDHETILATAWLAAEHILSHSKIVTYSRFFGVCMGVRLLTIIQGAFSTPVAPKKIGAASTAPSIESKRLVSDESKNDCTDCKEPHTH